MSWSKSWVCFVATFGVAGCALRSGDIAAERVDSLEFVTWDCARLAEERDRVQRRAADVAYAVDERAGNNIVAMGVGVMVFWPAFLAMRPLGEDARTLAALKGRDDALQVAAVRLACPPDAGQLPASRAAALPVAAGEVLVYEEGSAALPARPAMLFLRVESVRRQGMELTRLGPEGQPMATWQQDMAGNLGIADQGPVWSRLLAHDMRLGQVMAGQMTDPRMPHGLIRLRGQVVAVGPQAVAGRRFDAAVVELFGDLLAPDQTARVEGTVVVDRASGVLLSLHLRSPASALDLQRRLVRVDRSSR